MDGATSNVGSPGHFNPRPNRSLGRPRRGDSQDEEPIRERIFRIATELFARNGFDATGVQELSDAVGLGRGALYYHIKSKDDLLFSICLALHDNMLEQAETVVQLDLPADLNIRRLAAITLADLARNRDAWTVSLSELRALPVDRRQEIVARRDQFEGIWASLLRSAAAEGLTRPVDNILLQGILGLLSSTHLWIREDGPLSPAEVADKYIDLVMDGLRPR